MATRAEEEIALLARLLQEGRYEPKAVRRVWIDKLGRREQRPRGIPTVRDRIVQSALLHILEPIFERDFAEGSYGFRPGRSARQAVEVVEQNLAGEGTWVVDADLKGYFDSIPQGKLLACVREKVADGKVLALLEKFLNQGVMETGKGWEPTSQGTPQGAARPPCAYPLYVAREPPAARRYIKKPPGGCSPPRLDFPPPRPTLAPSLKPTPYVSSA